MSDSTRREWAAAATRRLAEVGLGPVRWVAETGSTNADLLAEAAEGAAAGQVLVADHQTSGRGRRGRTWETAPGDALLVSVLLRPTVPADRLAVVTAALSVATVEAAASLGLGGIGIKWPNDLVVGEPGARRKLAGILAQSQVDANGIAVVVGMGVNVSSARLADPTAVALDEFGPPPDRLTLLTTVFKTFATWLERATDDAPELWDRYRRHSATLGTVVRCELEDEVLLGTADDIDPTGALLIAVDVGPRRKIVTGDVVSVREVH